MAKQKARKGVEKTAEASVTSGPAGATRARTKVAAKTATEKKFTDETAGVTRSRRKQRTDKGSIEEKRRKRTKTCEKKLNELGEMTDTLALFGYYDPKTDEWHGSIHTPDGQQIPADIYDKVSVKHGRTSRS